MLKNTHPMQFGATGGMELNGSIERSFEALYINDQFNGGLIASHKFSMAVVVCQETGHGLRSFVNVQYLLVCSSYRLC